MNFVFVNYSLVFFAAAILCSGIAVTAWKRQRFHEGGFWFVALIVAIAEWSFCAGMEAIAVGIPSKVLWSKISYFGVISSSPFLLLFSHCYTQQKKRVSIKHMIQLWIIPVGILILALTNDLHYLLWSSYSAGPEGTNIILYNRGPAFWVSIAFAYLLVLISFLIVLRAFIRAHPPLKQQFSMLMIAISMPMLLNGIYMSRWSPLGKMDFTPIGFAATGVIIAWSLLRFNFLDIVPVGRTTMVDKMPTGMLVLDKKMRIADINPSAIQLLNLKEMNIIGRQVESVFPKNSHLERILTSTTDIKAEALITENGKRFIDVQVSLLTDKNQKIQGKLILIQDISGRKKMEDELFRLATQDPLTGIKNRRSLMDKLTHNFLKAKRYNRPLTFAIIDIDHFKRINDKHGHMVGDEILKEIVTRCDSSLRETDIFGRLGGEEFGVCFPETDIKGALTVCERLRSGISSFPFFFEKLKIPCSISIGLSIVGETDISVDDLMNRADKALYEAKRKGRNQISKLLPSTRKPKARQSAQTRNRKKII